MESGSNGASCMMAFGENSYGLCPMTPMMPLMTSHHSHHHPNADSNSLLPPLPPANNHDQNRNRNPCNSASFILQDHNNNSNTGYYFMENNSANNESSSSAVKAKIMAHPHYQRLLAAYINCQKVKGTPILTQFSNTIRWPKRTTLPLLFRALSLSSMRKIDQFMKLSTRKWLIIVFCLLL